MQESVQTVLDTGVKDKIFPGSAVAVIRPNQPADFFVTGSLRYNDQVFVSPNTIYDVASVTKSIPTSCIALQLLEEGIFRVQDNISTFLPDFKAQYAEEVTFWHLLTQTLCFDLTMSKIKDKTGPEILAALYSAPMTCHPGEKYCYMNATSVVLSRVLEKILGQSLEQMAQQSFFQPLQMENSSFQPHEQHRDRIAPSEIDETWRVRELVGEVHDESAWQLQQSGILVGSAGLFSTVQDLARFVQMLLQQGEFEGKSYFKPETITLMHTNQAKGIRGEMGLGWELAQPWMGTEVGEHAFGKTGFTGCFVLIEPELELGIVMLSNATYPHRPADRTALGEVRQRVISACLHQ